MTPAVPLDLEQLCTLATVIDEGTLDAAARALHVTPSAVSQRLKALEVATGRVLLVRTKPVSVTSSGEVVLRLARQVVLLAAQARVELGADDGAEPPVVAIAVNADSLATWVLPALASTAAAACFDLRRADQARTGELLRDGTVMAAVTAQAAPVTGCTSTPLGAMRYRPVASPAFAARWFPDGVTARGLARAPVVVFDRDDDLQHRYLRRRGLADVSPPTHHVPASADFLTAVRLGFGWGVLPDLQAADHVRGGVLTVLDPRATFDVALHWQQWKLRSPALDRVCAAITAAARTALGTPV